MSSQVKTPFKNESKSETVLVVKDVLEFEEVPEPDFDMTYHTVTPELLKYITGRVRITPEYRAFTHFVKNFLDVNRCSFYENFSMENGFTIELHHHPFSLYDICEAIVQKQHKENGYFETYIVVEEALRLHYQFMVGLTPLNPTAHDLVHNEELSIHPDIIIGEWEKLYKDYFPYLSETALKKYDDLLVIRREQKVAAFPKILEMSPQKIIVKGVLNVIDEKRLNNLMIEKKMQEVDKLALEEGSS
jgi:hypothetical protein